VLEAVGQVGHRVAGGTGRGGGVGAKVSAGIVRINRQAGVVGPVDRVVVNVFGGATPAEVDLTSNCSGDHCAQASGRREPDVAVDTGHREAAAEALDLIAVVGGVKGQVDGDWLVAITGQVILHTSQGDRLGRRIVPAGASGKEQGRRRDCDLAGVG